MNQTDDFQHDTPNKNSLNALAYYGKRKFNPLFLGLYMLGGVAVCIIVNLILDGGVMTTYNWWFSIIAGVAIGMGLYFWDLWKAQKKR